MEFEFCSHRNALTLFENDAAYSEQFREIVYALESIRDEDLIAAYEGVTRRSKKSLSEPINDLIHLRLTQLGWSAESRIFNDPGYNEAAWRLDFAKGNISLEVAFNHGEAISWNLLKPIMASELNHVAKAIQTSAGVVIAATQDLKTAGNFDNAVGTYEKFQRYLTPMYNVLPAPLLLIGLKAPRTFYIDRDTRQIAYYLR